jgi:hypothetical protein
MRICCVVQALLQRVCLSFLSFIAQAHDYVCLLFAPSSTPFQLQQEKERAMQSTVKQREVLKDSIAKARACTTLAEQQLEGQTALASQLQLEKEELTAAAQIQLTELEVRVRHSSPAYIGIRAHLTLPNLRLVG